MPTIISPEPPFIPTTLADIEIFGGSQFSAGFPILDNSGAAVDVSTYTMHGEIRAHAGQLLATFAMFVVDSQTSGRGFGLLNQQTVLDMERDFRSLFPASYEFKLQSGSGPGQVAISVQRGAVKLSPRITQTGTPS